jgi:hypothetical protein
VNPDAVRVVLGFLVFPAVALLAVGWRWLQRKRAEVARDDD